MKDRGKRAGTYGGRGEAPPRLIMYPGLSSELPPERQDGREVEERRVSEEMVIMDNGVRELQEYLKESKLNLEESNDETKMRESGKKEKEKKEKKEKKEREGETRLLSSLRQQIIEPPPEQMMVDPQEVPLVVLPPLRGNRKGILALTHILGLERPIYTHTYKHTHIEYISMCRTNIETLI